MKKELARTLTCLFADYYDRWRKRDTMDMSSGECESLERAFIDERFDDIESYMQKKFEKCDFTNRAKDAKDYADKYSHKVWEMLMERFRRDENFSIGCNDVSDIVLNAILDTLNGMSYAYVDQQQFVSEEEWKQYDKMMAEEDSCKDGCCNCGG